MDVLLLAQTDLLDLPGLPTAVALLSLSLLCGILSLIVVWRRWAFLGEGIAHAGMGGAGTAWLLAVLFPVLDRPGLVDLGVVVFCLFSAFAIGTLHQRERVQSDTAIGAWLVGSLAWGFVGQKVYLATFHRMPVGFEALLFGQTELLSWTHAQLALALLVTCVALLAYFRRPILLWCVEPTLAEVSGIPVARYQHLLILLTALTITLGVRLVGSVLITALLILPGSTAMLLSKRLGVTVVLAAGLGLLGAGFGIAMHARWPVLPQGPLMVLGLFAVFLVAWQVQRGRAG